MKSIYQKALKNSMNFDQYLVLVDQMIAENKSTGLEQNEMFTEFTQLNKQRMKRIYKTQQLSDETIQVINSLNDKQIWLVLVESWCGDAAQNLPILQKMAEVNNSIDLRIVLRDENEDLMQKYLTNNSRSIPKLIAVSEDLERELFTWGPRPAEAHQLVMDLKAKYGSVTAEVKEALQKWYNDNKGVVLQQEMLEAIKNAAI